MTVIRMIAVLQLSAPYGAGSTSGLSPLHYRYLLIRQPVQLIHQADRSACPWLRSGAGAGLAGAAPPRTASFFVQIQHPLRQAHHPVALCDVWWGGEVDGADGGDSAEELIHR